jgi:serine carboxypeptidase-like clade 2
MDDVTNSTAYECSLALNQGNQEVGDYVNPYDVIIDVCYPSVVEQELRLRKMVTKMSLGVDVCMSSERFIYLNLPEVQNALHANTTKLPYSWSMCSNVLNYSSQDASTNILPVLKRIIEHGVRVWIYSGDQDAVVPLLGSRSLVRKLADDINLTVYSPYRAWYQNGQVAGWSISYGKLLTFATVRGAAHLVPYSQPSRALLLFKTFLSGKGLPNNIKKKKE